MPRIGHFKVTVEVNGEPATEFEDDDDEPAESNAVVTKYIEAMSGANFGIKCQVLAGYEFDADCLSFAIFLDGTRAGGFEADKSEYDIERGTYSVRRHVSVGEGKSRERLAYRFADLNTREAFPGERVEDMKAKYKALGTISVQVWRKKIIGYKEIHGHDATSNYGSTDIVPEKALKGRALSLTTSLVPSGKAKPMPVSVKISKRVDKNAIATLNFKYRSRKALQSLRILAESSPPVPLEERPLDELTADELRDLGLRPKARLKAIKPKDEEKPVLKRERALSSIPVTPRPCKVSRTTDGKIVYELDSDDGAEPFVGSASRTASEKAAKVEVLDLLN